MRRCISILMLMLVSSFLWAQDLDLGFKVGYPLTFLYGQDYEAEKAEEKTFLDSAFFISGTIQDNLKPGFYGDLFCTIGIMDYLAIQPEVTFSYIQAGYQLSYQKPGYRPYSIDITYDYALIEIPLLVKGRFALNQYNTMILTVFSGPEMMIDLTTPKQTRIQNNGVAVQTDVITSNPLYYKHGAFSIVFGAGFDYFLRRKNTWFFTFDARYNLSLTSFNNSPVPASNDQKMHIITLSIGMGWKVNK